MLDNKKLVIGLGTVVVLLVAIVVVLVFQQNQGVPPVGQVNTGVQPTGSQPTTGNPGVAPSTAFDPKTATKVPAGMTPEKYVAAYYQAILDKKWQKAFDMQPASSKSGSAQDFASTQQSYGMTKFKVTGSTASGNEVVVSAVQTLGQYGDWGADWTFVKQGNKYLVKGRKISSPGTP